MRLDYRDSPSPHIEGSVDIGVTGKPAMQTTKLSLAFSIALLAIATFRTGAGRVAGINGHNRYPFALGLVCDEGAQLMEGPAGMLRPVAPPNRYSLADTLEFFKGNPSRCAFSGRDQALADDVVDVCPIASFTPPDSLEDAFAGACS